MMKLKKHLFKSRAKELGSIYIIDEPTTGLAETSKLW